MQCQKNMEPISVWLSNLFLLAMCHVCCVNGNDAVMCHSCACLLAQLCCSHHLFPTLLPRWGPQPHSPAVLHLLSLAMNGFFLLKVFWRSRGSSGDRAQQDFRRSMQAATAMCTSHGTNSVVWNIGAPKTASISAWLYPLAMLEVCLSECFVRCLRMRKAPSLHEAFL